VHDVHDFTTTQRKTAAIPCGTVLFSCAAE
jgi:hypothetical protein